MLITRAGFIGMLIACLAACSHKPINQSSLQSSMDPIAAEDAKFPAEETPVAEVWPNAGAPDQIGDEAKPKPKFVGHKAKRNRQNSPSAHRHEKTHVVTIAQVQEPKPPQSGPPTTPRVQGKIIITEPEASAFSDWWLWSVVILVATGIVYAHQVTKRRKDRHLSFVTQG